MTHNLLLKNYDKHINMFLNGMISFSLFCKIEANYIKKYKLFIINLN